LNTSAESIQKSAQTVSDASQLAGKAAEATSGTTSKVGRAAAAVSGIRLGVKLIPAAARLVRQYPIAAGLVVAGALWIAYSARARHRRRFDDAAQMPPY
jgi:hypothetical protein